MSSIQTESLWDLLYNLWNVNTEEPVSPPKAGVNETDTAYRAGCDTILAGDDSPIRPYLLQKIPAAGNTRGLGTASPEYVDTSRKPHSGYVFSKPPSRLRLTTFREISDAMYPAASVINQREEKTGGPRERGRPRLILL